MARIAAYLLERHGVEHRDFPGKPVPRKTIWQWIRKATKHMTKEQEYRRDVMEMLAAREIDTVREMVYKLKEEHQIKTFEENIKFLELVLKVFDKRVSLHGLNAPVRKQKEVTHRHEGGVAPKKLDQQAEQQVAKFEHWLKNGS
jgi:hypothetical protein